MKLIKKSERHLKASSTLKCFRDCGAITTEVQEYDRYKELSDGGKLQVKLTIYKVEFNTDTLNDTFYLLVDTLGRIATEAIRDLYEITSWLKEHGYKKDSVWYKEDYGMDDETWEEWNR